MRARRRVSSKYAARRADLDKRILARMAAGPFTFQDLQAIGNTDGVGGETWRTVETLMQKRRKTGEIVHERRGRIFVWHEVSK